MTTLTEFLATADTDNAVALNQAHTFSEQVLKPLEGRMMNERTVLGLIGMQSGETFMQSLEAAPDSLLPSRVKAWFKPSEAGIDVATPSAVGLIDTMAGAGAITVDEAGLLKGYAYNTVTPFERIELPDVLKARGVYAEEIALPDNKTRHILTLSISNTLSSITRVQVMQRFGSDMDSLTEWHECASFVGVKYSQSVYRCSVPESQGVVRQLKVVTYENLGMSVA